MRISTASAIAAAVLAVALVTQGAPVIVNLTAVLETQPAATSMTLLASRRLGHRSELKNESNLSTGSSAAFVVKANEDPDASQPTIEELRPRSRIGTIEKIINAANEITRAIDTAKGNPVTISDLTKSSPLITPSFGGQRAGPNWVGHHPMVGRALALLRSKVPKLANGMPDFKALSTLTSDKYLANKYDKLMKQINSASDSRRKSRKRALELNQQSSYQVPQLAEAEQQRLSSSSGSAPRFFADLTAPGINADSHDGVLAAGSALNGVGSSASVGLSKSLKRKLPSEADIEAARAFIESPSLPKTLNGSIDVNKISKQQLGAYQEARRLVKNAQRRDTYKARKLTSQSSPGNSAGKNTNRLFDLNAPASPGSGDEY